MTSSYKPTAEVKNKITLNNYDEDDIKERLNNVLWLLLVGSHFYKRSNDERNI